MQVKDYYAMLELEPGATPEDIKRNFRRLAMRYHPDTNQGNRHSEAWFRELQEAYDTLSDPAKKEAYLQQRWLWKATGKPFAAPMAFTPEMVLAKSRQLASEVAGMDHFRMNHEALRQRIETLLQWTWLDMLQHYGDNTANDAILENLIRCCEPLDFRQLDKMGPVLTVAEDMMPEWRAALQEYIGNRRRRHFWDQYQAPAIIVITLLLCALIFAISG